MNDNQLLKDVKVYYRFRRFKLFYGKLRSLVLDIHHKELLNDDSLIIPPPKNLDPTIDCVIIRSHPIAKPLQRISWRHNGYITYIPAQYRRYYIEFNSSFSDYLKKFSRKTRKNFRAYIRKYNKFCNSEKPWKEFRQANEIEEFYCSALEISRKTYQKRLFGTGIPEGDNFLQHIKRLAADDSFRGYILFHGDRPVSYFYCTVINKAVYAWSMGFDPAYKKWWPGTILFYRVLETLYKEKNYRLFDFGEETDYKKFFCTNNFFSADICFFKWRLKNLFIIFSHLIANMASRAILKICGMVIRKYKIKRWILAHTLRAQFDL